MSLDTEQLGAFLVAAVALVASPGPATLGLAGAGAAFGFRNARLFLAGLLCGAALVISLVGSGVVGVVLAQPVLAPILTFLAGLYMVLLAYRIATAPPLGRSPGKRAVPGFLPGFLLAISNPKAYAVFATLFSGFVIVPDEILGNAVLKGCVIMAMVIVIDLGWLYAGSALRRMLRNRRISRRINVAFAVLLLMSVAWTVGA